MIFIVVSFSHRSVIFLNPSFLSDAIPTQIHLLEAEQFSFENNNSEAHTSYAAAISSACLSGFVHEQGLACELAGYHYKKVGDFRSALCFFGQAKRCYTEWGSQMKLDNVTHQFDSLADRVADDPL